MGEGTSKVGQYRVCERMPRDRRCHPGVREGVERVDQSEGGEREESARGEREGVDLITFGTYLSTTDILPSYSRCFSRVVVKRRKERVNLTFLTLDTTSKWLLYQLEHDQRYYQTSTMLAQDWLNSSWNSLLSLLLGQLHLETSLRTHRVVQLSVSCLYQPLGHQQNYRSMSPECLACRFFLFIQPTKSTFTNQELETGRKKLRCTRVLLTSLSSSSEMR